MNTKKKNIKCSKSETKYFRSDINNKKCRRIFADIFYLSQRRKTEAWNRKDQIFEK